ncbi:methylated-DNA--[protein]-cysteine S-methyltransferase [Kiloniella majae]|uniref:methylated-DNA--[protein]-cysteine S-methyltransferase n=1 Tax=Kiloniella majae TaxID=1938558 RepID=UPI000A27934E|nr:methylated-DNA--[protein]-cysteine S-methyltransferase [Kiloniella majae]
MYTDYIETPLGMVEIKASEKGVRHVIFCGSERTAVEPSSITDRCKQQLKEYFDGSRKEFDLSLDPQGTDFQKSVWAILTKISFGETLSYMDIAEKLSNPKGVRAVGGANGRNPISLILPCHRVVGSNGTLTGYAGGVARKQWLLEHEGIQLNFLKKTEQLDLQDVIYTRQDKTRFLK